MAILLLQVCAATGSHMVHLRYVHHTLAVEHIQLIWKHLALHLGKSAYIAYIDNKPQVQHLAESVGFKQLGDSWLYDNT